jgi:uncharacterized NAD(P)/FAD-binding protein YdhS
VVVIGTGLTMVDIVLLLKEEGFTGPILALSRRGLVPRAHGPGPAPVPRQQVPVAEASALVRDVRKRSAEVGWRAAVDELRPVTQQLWRSAAPGVRARFLRHLRPWWDVHRHRIAPEIDQRLQAMIDSGQLRVAAGKISGIAASGSGVELSWRPRGGEGEERIRAPRIINCTGPEANLRGSADPLLHRLLANGSIRPDPPGIGVDVDLRSRLISAEGTPHANLFAVGPITRGAFWETVAVPDIRQQVQQVAQHVVRPGSTTKIS